MNKILKTGATIGLLVAATAAQATIMTYNSDDPNLPITFQGGPNTVTSSFSIADSGIIDDLDVSLSVQTGFFSELDVSLTAPDGTVVDLFTGFTSNSSLDVTFDDEAAQSISDINGAFDVPDPTFNPFDALTPEGTLSDFDGGNLLGDWTLTLTDNEDFFIDDPSDASTLFSWSITAATVPEPGTLALVGVAGLMMMGLRTRRRNQQ